jgi:streptogramin lyase
VGDESSYVASITLAGVITEYTLGSGAQPFGIGLSGSSSWIAEFAAGKIARANLAGAVTEYQIPTAPATSIALVITGGEVWFTEPAVDKIAELSCNTLPAPSSAIVKGSLCVVGTRYSRKRRVGDTWPSLSEPCSVN